MHKFSHVVYRLLHLRLPILLPYGRLLAVARQCRKFTLVSKWLQLLTDIVGRR